MRKIVTLWLFLMSVQLSHGQTVLPVYIDSTQLVSLEHGWKYFPADTKEAAHPSFDDHAWMRFNPASDIVYNPPQTSETGIAWARLTFSVPDNAHSNGLSLMIRQTVASEIYLNGVLLRTYGKIGEHSNVHKAEDPRWEPIPIHLQPGAGQVLAVRFAVQPIKGFTTFYGNTNPIFDVRIAPNQFAASTAREIYMWPWMDLFMQGIVFMVMILHFTFYIQLPSQKANLYFGIAALFQFAGGMFHDYLYFGASPDQKYVLALIIAICYASFQILSLVSVHVFLKLQHKAVIWTLIALSVFSIAIGMLWYLNGFKFFLGWMPIVSNLIISAISYNALKKKIPRSLLLLSGYFISAVSFLIFLSLTIPDSEDALLRKLLETRTFFFFFYLVGPPAAMSLFLAADFAHTSKRLDHQLREVERLSEEKLKVEKEKQEILASQNLELEAKVRDRTASLSQSLRDLQSTQAQLIQSEKMASLGELTAGIAHEIQNPLNFVNNFSDLNQELIDELKEELMKGDVKEAVSIVDNLKENEAKINLHGRRADGIVKSMLQHSRSSSGQKEPTDINKLVDEYTRLAYHGFRARYKDFNVKLDIDLDQNLPRLPVVAQDIGRVILNLLNNAFQAVEEKARTAGPDYQPTVTIETKSGITHSQDSLNPTPVPRNAGSEFRNPKSISIAIADNGPGIPDTIKDKIFQPFFTTKPTGQGTGLGLSLSYDIVKAHGGSLRFETAASEGTRFIVELPAGN